MAKGHSQVTWSLSPNYANWTCQSSLESHCVPWGESQVFQVNDHWIFARDWEIGLSDSLGIFPSSSLNLRAEFPHTLGLGMNLGLPSGYDLQHSLGLGYEMGLWADNTWWSAYGLQWNPSPAWKSGFSLRFLDVATQQGDLKINPDSNQFLTPLRVNLWQMGVYEQWLWHQGGFWPAGLQVQALWQSRFLPSFGQSSLSYELPRALNHGFWSLQLGLIWHS